jgi:hypothetical protein
MGYIKYLIDMNSNENFLKLKEKLMNNSLKKQEVVINNSQNLINDTTDDISIDDDAQKRLDDILLYLKNKEIIKDIPSKLIEDISEIIPEKEIDQKLYIDFLKSLDNTKSILSKIASSNDGDTKEILYKYYETLHNISFEMMKRFKIPY